MQHADLLIPLDVNRQEMNLFYEMLSEVNKIKEDNKDVSTLREEINVHIRLVTKQYEKSFQTLLDAANSSIAHNNSVISTLTSTLENASSDINTDLSRLESSLHL